MTPKLGAADKRAIKALSRSQIEITTAGLKPFLKRSVWIGKTNHYANDVVKRLKKSLPVGAGKQRNLAQYVAASVTLHSNDGWSFLGRAIACLLAGDTHRALHLAYYAELRGAISLLASVGIGIFNTKHFIMPAANTISKLNYGRGTHEIAWLTLEHWSRLPASGMLFARLVRPEGRTLNDWFQPQGGAVILAPQAKSWFMQWGMDLGFASKDRDARNDSSYRPDGIPTTWNVVAKDCLEFVRDLWSMLEPSSNSSFEQIDRHILRVATERHFHGSTGKSPVVSESTFVASVASIVEAQNLSASTEARLKRFLLRQEMPADPLIFKYSALRPGNPQTDAYAVLSRAVLLLRIATGSAHDLLQQAGFKASELSFWWQKIGEARGLWQAGSPPTTLNDLWADIDDSLNQLTEIEAANPTAIQSINNIAFGMDGHLNVLSSHERVGLWGLCPE